MRGIVGKGLAGRCPSGIGDWGGTCAGGIGAGGETMPPKEGIGPSGTLGFGLLSFGAIEEAFFKRIEEAFFKRK